MRNQIKLLPLAVIFLVTFFSCAKDPDYTSAVKGNYNSGTVVVTVSALSTNKISIAYDNNFYNIHTATMSSTTDFTFDETDLLNTTTTHYIGGGSSKTIQCS